MKDLIAALLKARMEFSPIQKDGVNPHYKKRYATLDTVIGATVGTLAKHGLAVAQLVGLEGERAVLRTQLLHTSGQTLESCYPLPDQSDPQKLGAALTYARRYALCALLNVAAEDDDDGNSAKAPKTNGNQQRKPGTISQAQAKRMFAIATEHNWPTEAMKAYLKQWSYESSKDIRTEDYDAIVAGFSVDYEARQAELVEAPY